MSYHDQEPEEMQVEEALRHFRASVHAWSEREMEARPNRAPAAARGWHWMTAPVLRWGLAGALTVTAVTVPVAVRHEHQQTVERQAALQEQQRRVAEDKARLQASAVNDEELLTHVDSDIAQSTPDAMEPLASLMRDSTNQ